MQPLPLLELASHSRTTPNTAAVAVSTRVGAVSVDSRRLVPRGAVFFALQGTRTDGHAHVAEALQAGCVAAVVREDRLGDLDPSLPLLAAPTATPAPDAPLQRDDPVLAALERLAAWWRGQLPGPVLAITGSNGKTTVKSALQAVLSRTRRVAASPGSWNSRLGVALSLIGMETDAEIALVEAGVSEPGDMPPLQAMIRPDLGLLTGIGMAHLGAFGHPDAIGREKLRLFEDLSPTHGWLLIPDDPRCLRLVQGAPYPVRVFGPGAPNGGMVSVTRRSTTHRLGQVVRLHFADRSHFDIEIDDTSPAQVQNVAAAATAGALLGVPPADIADALDGFRPPPQRLETWRTPDGVTVINDCYSSDPNSTDAALRALSHYPAGRRRVFVFGGMAGLGEASEEEHRHVGRLAGSLGISRLVTVGDLAATAAEEFEGQVSRVSNPAEALAAVRKTLRYGDVVLVKGPTRERLDHVARALVDSSASTRLVVNLTAVEANLRQIGRHVGPGVGLCAIVKAEAYGGDPVRLSHHLERVGVTALGVAFAEEGVALRRAAIACPILVLSPARGDAERIVRHRLTPVVHAHYTLTELEQEAALQKRPVGVHLKVDTGMGRYGFFPPEVLPVARRIQQSDHLRLEGLMTHFAAAEDPAEDEFTRSQIARFEEVTAQLREAGIEVPLRHAAATAAAIRFPEARYDMVRVGLGLYGVSPSPACREVLALEYAVAAVSRIASIKIFPPGHTIGYGRRYRVGDHPERIAFIPCGYHDALWRDLYQGGAEVIVRGVRCPIVGTVSMDSAPVNITAVPEADVGDDVLLFGAWQDQVLPPEEIARQAGTVAHELLSAVGPRVQRIYQEG